MDKRFLLWICIFGLCSIWSGLVLAQDDDALKLKICDSAGECCLGGLSQPIEDAWIDPDSGDLHVTGTVRCLHDDFAIVYFQASPNPVVAEETFAISWQAIEATGGCLAGGGFDGWSGLKSASGSEEHIAGDEPGTYKLVLFCAGEEDQSDTAVLELVVTE